MYYEYILDWANEEYSRTTPTKFSSSTNSFKYIIIKSCYW